MKRLVHLLFQYFCYECKLFDDEDKAQFHCDGCGICRIGGRENFFHCATCNMCLPTHLEGKHKVTNCYLILHVLFYPILSK